MKNKPCNKQNPCQHRRLRLMDAAFSTVGPFLDFIWQRAYSIPQNLLLVPAVTLPGFCNTNTKIGLHCLLADRGAHYKG